MRKSFLAVAAASAIFLIATACHGMQEMPRGSEAPRSLPTYQHTAPPFGYVAFCLKTPSACSGGTDYPAPVELTPEIWRQLVQVNDYVNALPQRMETAEDWRYANEFGGDCEDLALLKQKLLMQAGWPESASRLAVVEEWSGTLHVVLVLETTRGEFVLDNKSWEILPWLEAPYKWRKIQSRERPYVWLNMDPKKFRKLPQVDFPSIGCPPPFVLATVQSKVRSAGDR